MYDKMEKELQWDEVSTLTREKQVGVVAPSIYLP